MDIFERVKKLNLPLGEYAVFGSALLDVWGIRKASDLDIIVTPKLFEELKKKDWEYKKANGFDLLRKGDADVTSLQNKPTDGNYCPDRLKLIKEAVVINEIPFVIIEEVIACKRAYNRPKDLEDIKEIEKFIENKDVENLYKN